MGMPRIIRYGFYTTALIAAIGFAGRYALGNQDLTDKVKEITRSGKARIEQVRADWQKDISYEKFEQICKTLGPEKLSEYTQRYKKEMELEMIVGNYGPAQ